jgi:hypothetical protein
LHLYELDGVGANVEPYRIVFLSHLSEHLSWSAALRCAV